MKLLGVDYGTTRAGLATGDTEVSLAFPLRSFAVESEVQIVTEVLSAAKNEDAEAIIVGIPYRLRDVEKRGETEVAIMALIDALKEATTLPIETEDERFTSAIAERRRREADIPGKSFDTDAAAAVVILETYMERKG